MSRSMERSHIQLKIILKMAIANLWFKRFRSFVTILGVIIGIGSIYLLVSFGIGLQQLVEDQITGNRAINTVDVSSASSRLITLTPEAINQMRSIEHVSAIDGVYTLASKVTIDGSSADLVAYGVGALYLDLTEFSLEAGSPLDTAQNNQLLINSSLLESVGVTDFGSAIGKEATVSFERPDGSVFEKKLRIIGVADSGQGSEVFMSEKVFQEANIPNFAVAKALVDDRDAISEVRYAIESMGYETVSPVDTVDQINEVFRFLNLILVGLGSVGLVIAILGMLNTLTVSLLERTREIALMITLGARPKDMQRLFTAEAVLLSLTGGVAGMLLATLLGRGVDMVINIAARERGVSETFHLFALSWELILGTLVFVVLIGVIVSFVPARRAARINVVKALRQE